MEPNTRTIATRGSLGGEQVEMGIDEASIVALMDLLTNLYSDPELAVLREYSTNAWDSHVEAGVTRPIEVTLPSNADPTLKIKDFGVGLSVDELTRVYSKYGASTKRDTNDQAGMLGVGGKSALTYTNSFTVVAVKNGVKAHVQITRVGDGRPVMNIVDTCGTNEANGVEIRVPAKQYNTFAVKAQNFFRFWQPGSVLVDGVAPTVIEGKEVAPNIFMVEGLDSDYVVMGQIGYPTERRMWQQANYTNFGLVAYVKIGDIDFTPSREALHYTKRSEQTIERVSKEFEAGLTKAILTDVEAAPNHGEALARFRKWSRMLSYAMIKDVKYKNQDIPKSFDGNFITYDTIAHRYNASHHTRIDFRYLQDAVIVHGFTPTDLTSSHKQKMRRWKEDNAKHNRYFVIVNAPFGQPWLSGFDLVAWDDIKSIKLTTRTANGTRAATPQYETWGTHSSGTWKCFSKKDAPVDNGQPIYYCSPREKLSEGWYTALTDLDKSATIVCIGENRFEKFKRDYPKAVSVRKAIERLYTDAKAALTQQDKEALGIQQRDTRLINNLDPAKIDDPAVKDYINLVKGHKTSSKTIAEYTKWANVYRQQAYFNDTFTAPKNPLEKYRLINTSPYGAPLRVDSHLYCYMNAAYKEGLVK